MTPTGEAYPLRLQLIYEELSVIIDRYHPQEAAIEKLFFGKNVTTAIGVAQARGVALLTVVQSGLTIAEYTPGEVKLASRVMERRGRSRLVYGTAITRSANDTSAR